MVLRFPDKHPRQMPIPRSPLPSAFRHDLVPLLEGAFEVNGQDDGIPWMGFLLVVDDVSHVHAVTQKHVVALEYLDAIKTHGSKGVEALKDQTHARARGRDDR